MKRKRKKLSPTAKELLKAVEEKTIPLRARGLVCRAITTNDKEKKCLICLVKPFFPLVTRCSHCGSTLCFEHNTINFVKCHDLGSLKHHCTICYGKCDRDEFVS